MLTLLSQGDYSTFALILIALILSLTFHEYGHAISAKWFGDNTAKQQGRLTLNPIAHIDPLGLAMIVLVGFGYARPVPTNPANYNHRWAQFWVAAAGPLMNLAIAFITINIYAYGYQTGAAWALGDGAKFFFIYLATINLILMIFNLIPLGPLDGHYLMPYVLPRRLAYFYQIYNARYGSLLFIGLILLSVIGVPIFSYVFEFGRWILPYLIVI